MRDLKSELNQASSNAKDAFEKIRRSIGRDGYGVTNDALNLMKDGIDAIKDGHYDVVDRIAAEMQRAMELLDGASLPRHEQFRFRGQVEQELVELRFVARIYPQFFGIEEDDASMDGLDIFQLTPSVLDVTLQSWFAGLCDVPGELSKMLLSYRVKNHRVLVLADHVRLLERFVLLVGMVESFLGDYETVYEGAISTGAGRRFFQTFRGKLIKVRENVRRAEQELADLRLKQEHENTLRAILEDMRAVKKPFASNPDSLSE